MKYFNLKMIVGPLESMFSCKMFFVHRLGVNHCYSILRKICQYIQIFHKIPFKKVTLVNMYLYFKLHTDFFSMVCLRRP